tara:strand:- start:20961 stop:24257 length:3297 start_codon:yes stop_codon:yes gene_type:complete
MNKLRWYLVIIILFLLVVNVSVSVSVDDDEVKVSEEVIDILEDQDEVKVIVKLKDSVVEDLVVGDKTEKEIIEEIQEEVLDDLDASNDVSSTSDTNVDSDPEFIVDSQFENSPIITGTANQEAIQELILNPFVESVDFDMPVKAFLDASVPVIHAPEVWARRVNQNNITGTGQTICVIDSGIYYNHSNLGTEFGVKVLAGKNTITNTVCTANNDACDDDFGHGTHVAGIIVSDHATYYGVAPDANIVAIKSLNSGGGGDISDTGSGIDWCVTNKDAYNITIISMSLGTEELYTSSDCPTNIDASIASAYDVNITVIASSGNDGSTTKLSYPACNSQVISVGGSDDNDALYSSSNRNSDLEILAPGVSITSTYIGTPTTFAIASGTSMSAPHVAGAIALLRQDQWEKNQINLTVSEINTLIQTTNVSISGFPRIDAYLSMVPNVSFVGPTPENGSSIHASSIYVNITTYRKINNSFVGINGTNYTLTPNADGNNFYLNVTGLTGFHNYTVYMNDSSDTLFKSEIQYCNTSVNARPVITLIENITVWVDLDTNDSVDFTVTATDSDADTLYYDINMSNISKFSNRFMWNVTYFNTGIYYVNITVNDSLLHTSQIVQINVGDLTDADNDSVYDILDTDDDNDGLVDTNDNVQGNSSSVTATSSSGSAGGGSALNLTVLIDNSTNLVQQFAGEYNLTMQIDENLTIEAVTNTSLANINLYNVTISKQNTTYSRGFLIVKGLQVSGTKTVYVDDINASFNTLCVKDADINNLSQITPGCNGANERLVTCNGLDSVYNCSRINNNTRYRITGLTHSAVHEQCADRDGDGYGSGCPLGSDCNDGSAAVYQGCSTDDGGGGGGGGGSSGGGGGSGAEVNEEETKTYGYAVIGQGQSKIVKVESEIIPITDLDFEVFNQSKSVTLTIKSYKKQPKRVKVSAPDIVYKYMNLEATNIDNDNLKNVLIDFRLNKSFVIENDLNMSTVKLNLYDTQDKEWTSYPVIWKSTSSDYYFYKTEVNGFNYMAITLNENFVPEVEVNQVTGSVVSDGLVEKDEEQPLFGLEFFSSTLFFSLLSLVIFLFIVVPTGYWVRKHKFGKHGKKKRKRKK